MSNLSSSSRSSTGASSPHILGIPTLCWCGSGITVYVSKSPHNTYRRFFRCQSAGSNRLENDCHIFKWVDEALLDEIGVLSNSITRLQCKVDAMEGVQASLLEKHEKALWRKAEKAVEKLEKVVEKSEANLMAKVDRAVNARVEEVLMERVEQALMERIGGVGDANSGLKKLIVVGVGVVVVGMMMFNVMS